MTNDELARLLLECGSEFEMCESHWGSDYTDIRTRLKAAAAELQSAAEPPIYDIDFALNIAQLWRANKMIGGDEDAVRNALLAEVERLRDDPRERHRGDEIDPKLAQQAWYHVQQESIVNGDAPLKDAIVRIWDRLTENRVEKHADR